MRKLYSLVAFSLLISKAGASVSMFESMHAHMEKMEQHLKEVMQDFEQEMEKDKSGFPELSSKGMPIAVGYTDADKVIVTVTFPEGSLKEVEAEAFDKQKIASINVPQEGGDTALKIDRWGIEFSSQQKIEKKTKKEDKNESVSVSYSNQSFYQSFEVPVEAQKAEVKIKADTLVISLPRETKKKKITVTREE